MNSSAYAMAASAMARRTALARAQAEARLASALRKAASDAARLDAADQAYKSGDLIVASRMYVSLAGSRQKTAASVEARKRLDRLAAEASQEIEKMDGELDATRETISPGELLSLGLPEGDQPAGRWAELVKVTFEGYEKLADDYGGVPAVGREIKSHMAQQRRRPEIAGVLDEPQAATLLELARKHEQEDHACCAYWVYKQAARLAPAPSAKLAQERFDQMQQDPQVVAAAEKCRQLQECHRIYNRAKMLAEARPGRAKELLAQIVDRAPPDSEVYRAAQEEIALMR